MDYYVKQITVEILQIKRLYYKVKYQDQDSPFDMQINDISKGHHIGDIITYLCVFEHFNFRGKSKTTVFPLTQNDIDNETSRYHIVQVRKLLRHIRKATKEGRYPQRAIDKLKQLNVDPELYKVDVKKAYQVYREKEIERWLGFLEGKALEGRIYERGLQELDRLGAREQYANNRRIEYALEVAEEIEKLRRQIKN